MQGACSKAFWPRRRLTLRPEAQPGTLFATAYLQLFLPLDGAPSCSGAGWRIEERWPVDSARTALKPFPLSKDCRAMSTSPAETTQTAAPSLPNSAPISPPLGDEPIRAELFGHEHLETHCRTLAESARLLPPPERGRDLHRHFRLIGRDLEEAQRRITAASRQGESISVDAEWLLDNF